MSKKIVLVVAPRNFRDEELFDTKAELELAGIETVIASNAKGIVFGKLGKTAVAVKTLNEIDSMDFDAISFIGGNGAEIYLNDKTALGLAEKFFSTGKIVSAICIAPSVLANAGLLKNRNATAFSDQLENLREKGAKVLAKPVVADGKIVTANGPAAAHEFGKKIAELLK